MVALPLAAAVISLAFTAVIAADALRRPRPHIVSWAIAFAIFTVAAGVEVAGATWGWTPALARVFYLTGAVLVTLFLGLGELYLLFHDRIRRVAPGLTMAVVAVAASLVWSAPIDEARLDAETWEAIDRGSALIAVVAISNAFGVVALAGGTGYSAWRFRRTGTQRHRMIGCILITAGTLTIAAKGYLERAGVEVGDDAFYGFLAVGAAIIFAGYLQTRRPDAAAGAVAPGGADAVLAPATSGAASPNGAATEPNVAVTDAGEPDGLVAIGAVDAATGTGGSRNGAHDRAAGGAASDEGIAFIEQRFLGLDDGALDRLATAWSAPRQAGPDLSREQARQVWALRLRLTPAGRAAFDRHAPAALHQLADLYFGVLSGGVGEQPRQIRLEPLGAERGSERLP